MTADRPARRDSHAARLAARRRRKVLITLVALTALVLALATFGLVSWWLAALPASLDLGWLIACRYQVRTEQGLSGQGVSGQGVSGQGVSGQGVSGQGISGLGRRRRSGAMGSAGYDTGRGTSVDTGFDIDQTVEIDGFFADPDPAREHRMAVGEELPDDALDEKLSIAVPVGSDTGGALWDPLPVTVPTYVTKPRAGRTVRTIDFGEPGTWTSGHVEGEDVELPRRGDEAGSARDVG